MLKVEDIFDTSLTPPEELDFITFEFRGITFRVRGVLHGVTGGASKEYIDLVKRSIKAATGFVMVEKNMSVLYGAPQAKELDDWLVLRFRDALMLSVKFYLNPMRAAQLARQMIKERLAKRDPFIVGGCKDETLIGGTPLFHYLDPIERRGVAGFPPPLKGLRRHLSLRAGEPDDGRDKAIVPTGEWTFLNAVEREVSIPLRSLHMLFFAWSYAKLHGLKELDLFVGETHNTDIAEFAAHADDLPGAAGLNDNQVRVLHSLIDQAMAMAALSTFSVRRLSRYASYMLALAIPITLGWAAFFVVFCEMAIRLI
jgi:hypothetical protein